MEYKKRKVMISYEKLPEPVRQELKRIYPDGFQQHLECITDHRNQTVHVLRHDTNESSFLIKMDNHRAHIINFLNDDREDIKTK